MFKLMLSKLFMGEIFLTQKIFMNNGDKLAKVVSQVISPEENTPPTSTPNPFDGAPTRTPDPGPFPGGPTAQPMPDHIQEVQDAVNGFFKPVTDTVNGVVDGVGDFLSDPLGAIEDAGMWLVNQVVNLISGLIAGIFQWANNGMVPTAENLFASGIDKFWTNVTTGLTDYLSIDPSSGSALLNLNTVYEAIKQISNTALLPLASLLLAFIFTKYFYELATDHNRNGEITSWDMFVIILRCAVCIELVAHAWDLVTWFWQLSVWFASKASAVPITGDGTFYQEGDALAYISTQINTFRGVPTGTPDLGTEGGLFVALLVIILVAFLVFVFSLVMLLCLYSIVLTRLINFLLYCSFAPIAVVTLIDKSYLGPIGQNYFKNLFAFALQTFLLIVVFNIGKFVPGMFNDMLTLYAPAESAVPDIGTLITNICSYALLNGFSMFIVFKLAQGSLGLAKSMVGAS